MRLYRKRRLLAIILVATSTMILLDLYYASQDQRFTGDIEKLKFGYVDAEKVPRKDTHMQILKQEKSDLDEKKRLVPDSSVCTYRTATYIKDKKIVLDQEPFLSLTNNMECLLNGKIAVFQREFVVFDGAVLDPSKGKSSRKGGEKMEDVWGQREDSEYFSFSPGYFRIPCKLPPNLKFARKNHLTSWIQSLDCYTNSSFAKEIEAGSYIKGISLLIQRYEYVNLYHTITDFYNAFVLKLLLHTSPTKFNIIFVDTHPKGDLDTVWSTLFKTVYRAGILERPTRLERMVWGMMGYDSPIMEHSLETVPYLEEFRDFFLFRHGISTSHTINCKRLNAVIVWRRDYVAHPRNKGGKVERKFSNEEEILKEVNDTLGPSATVVGVQLDALSMRKQLELISTCDILIGMHGAGLSHTLFLPKTSGLVEMLPAYVNSRQHFKSMARWRKIAYIQWQNTDQTLDKNNVETYIKPGVVKGLVQSINQEICKAL